MKNIKTLILLLFELVLLNQLVSAQIRVIDNKGTVSTIDTSKWVRTGTGNDIYAKYPGKVGIGTDNPYATLHNAGSTILGMTTATDVAAAYTIPATFVDNYTGVLIKQTNNLSTITLPEPTNKTIGRLFTISNANESTYSLIIAGTTYTIPPTQSGQFVWNGINWSLPGSFASSALSIAGDVSGSLGASTVDKLKNTALSISSLTSGNLLRYNGTNWANWAPNFLTLSSLSASAPLTYNSTTGAFSIAQAASSTDGYLLGTDWKKFNDKVTSVSAGSTKVAVGGTATDPTVDVVPANLGAITLATGTTGTNVNVSGSPASLGGTLTLNIPMASTTGVTAGLISKADYDAFTGKQAAIALTTTGTSGNATFSAGTLNIPNYTYTLPAATGSALGGVIVGTGLNVTAGTISTVNNGTVTNFSANDLSPLFSTTEATTTTTPALSFTLSNAAANTIFGNNTAASAAPSYFSATALPVAGDVTATLGASVVSRINGAPLGSTTGAATGNVLAWDGSAWTKASPPVPFSGFTAAIADNTVNNSTWAQTWNWTSTTQDPLTINANALTSGRALTIASTGAGNLTTGSLLKVSGQVASTTITNGLFTVNNTGASTTGIVATIKANNTGQGLTVRANGNVEVSGAARNSSAFDTGGNSIIDFSVSNIAITSSAAAGITLNNIKDGGAYTLIIKPGGTAAVGFTATGFSFVEMGTTARIATKTYIYSLIVANTTVYVTMAGSN